MTTRRVERTSDPAFAALDAWLQVDHAPGEAVPLAICVACFALSHGTGAVEARRVVEERLCELGHPELPGTVTALEAEYLLR